jgi:hypothetical protein
VLRASRLAAASRQRDQVARRTDLPATTPESNLRSSLRLNLQAFKHHLV